MSHATQTTLVVVDMLGAKEQTSLQDGDARGYARLLVDFPARERVVYLRSAEDIHAFWHEPHHQAVWIAMDSGSVGALVRESVQPRQQAPSGSLFVYGGPSDVDATRRDVLATHFEHVVVPPMRLLPPDELAAAVCSPHRDQLFIGVAVDARDRVLVFRRASCGVMVVSWDAFPPADDGVRPAFADADVEMIDFGRTVRLGEYEAAVNEILYAHDPRYRRELNRQRRTEDRSFGAALRRARMQQRLPQDAFEPDISARAIGRIERGEVQRPHPATLVHLAARLGMPVEEIETY